MAGGRKTPKKGGAPPEGREPEDETSDSEFDEEEEARAPDFRGGQANQARQVGADFDLQDLVAKPAWKELLFELVVKEGLDPWNIDVGLIAEKYLEQVKDLQMRDLRIPANLILAASILLRFKSDAIRLEEQVQEAETETFLAEGQQPVEIPVLTLRTRIPPKRKVSLGELVQALEDVFSDQKKREDWKSRPPEREVVVIQLPEFNIEKQMDEVFGRVKSSSDSEGLATFSSLLKEDSGKEKVYTLLPLLFLSQSGKINIFQEKFFGEIFIQLKDGEGSANPEGAQAAKGGGKRKPKGAP